MEKNNNENREHCNSNIFIKRKKNIFFNTNTKNYSTLKIQLNKSLILGMLIASIIFIIIYQSFGIAEVKYNLSHKISNIFSRHLLKEFSEYIEENKIKTSEYEKIQNWNKSKGNTINLLYVFKNNKLCYDSNYTMNNLDNNVINELEKIDENSLSIVKTYDIEKLSINFYDGYADVYIDTSISNYIYLTLFAILTFIWLSIVLLIFTKRLNREISYLNLLSNQAENIKESDYDKDFDVLGNNEISNLAKTLNNMKKSIVEKENTERELRHAQDKLVTGMAHDIRTPMTSLLNYAEILRKENKNSELDFYIGKILEKINDLSSLSDQMFEYFFIREKNIPNDFELTYIEHSIGEYLSELYAMLKYEGFIVDSKNLGFIDKKIKTSPDFLARIINNLFSNILKYADKSKPIFLYSQFDEKEYKVFIKNTVSKNELKLKGTKVGLDNIKFMMTHMDGYCIDSSSHKEDKEYYIMLSFNIH